MNRADLVAILASKNDLSKTAANALLDTLIDTIQTAVKKGDAVQLVGFGTFRSAKRAARAGKNPATVAALEIPASTVPKFVAGAKFRRWWIRRRPSARPTRRTRRTRRTSRLPSVLTAQPCAKRP